MNLKVDIQRIIPAPPTDDDFQRWVQAVMATEGRQDVELTIRIVDEAEISDLNQRYRGKAGATNVLSFPFEAPPGVQLNLLGDLVIAAPLVAAEAQQQDKSEMAHWAHLVVHGSLHLLGYDHQHEAQAEAMESREIRILHQLGYPNPYQLKEAS